MSGASIWEQFTLDPRTSENAHLRAGDHDRDVVNDLLGTAYSEGRLSAEELDERTDRVTASKTLGELPPIIADLVAPVDARLPVAPTDLRAEAERKYRQRRQQALIGWLTPTLICWVVWLTVLIGGAGTAFPWPVFVTVGTGVRFLQLVATRNDTVAGIEHGLQRRERRRLERRDRRRALGGPPPPPDPPALP